MLINSKGQITIPAHLRAKHGLHEGDEVDVIEVDGVLQIVHRQTFVPRDQVLAAFADASVVDSEKLRADLDSAADPYLADPDDR